MSDYLRLKIVDIKETRMDGGEVRITAQCENLDPESFNLNLSKKSAEIINQFRALKGLNAFVPCRRGVYDGNAFVSLDDGFITPLPTEPSKDKTLFPKK